MLQLLQLAPVPIITTMSSKAETQQPLANIFPPSHPYPTLPLPQVVTPSAATWEAAQGVPWDGKARKVITMKVSGTVKWFNVRIGYDTKE